MSDYPQGQFLFSTGRRSRGRVRRGSDATVKVLRELGRLEAVDEAVVIAVRAAADNVDAAERMRAHDEATPFMVANAIRTYAASVAMLYSRVGMLAPPDDDELVALLSIPPNER